MSGKSLRRTRGLSGLRARGANIGWGAGGCEVCEFDGASAELNTEIAAVEWRNYTARRLATS